jgi:hypothetical protein
MATLYPVGESFASLDALKIVPARGQGFMFDAIGSLKASDLPTFRVQRLTTSGRAVANAGTHAEAALKRFALDVPAFREAKCPR